MEVRGAGRDFKTHEARLAKRIRRLFKAMPNSDKKVFLRT